MSKKLFEPGWGAKLFFTIGGFCAFVGMQNGLGGGLTEGWDQFCLGWLFALPFLIIGGLLAQRDATEDQAWTNEQAEYALRDALQAIRQGEQQPITLYLRPFTLTHQLRFQLPHPASAPDPTAFYQPTDSDLETLLAKSFADTAPLIGLGEPNEQIGAGKVLQSEDAWQEAVQLLARSAKSILIVPSAQAGTLWEIRWLTEVSLLDKCVFLMPPTPAQSDLDLELSWGKAREALAKMGLKLPPYESGGMLFRFGESGGVSRHRALHLETEFLHSTSFFKDAVDELGPFPADAAEPKFLADAAEPKEAPTTDAPSVEQDSPEIELSERRPAWTLPSVILAMFVAYAMIEACFKVTT